jgi:type I restriction enzyme S subunit
MTALVTKHLPLVAGAPDGIKKLRALILDLAIRGKLVHQDPADTHAEVLLSEARDARSSKQSAKKSMMSSGRTPADVSLLVDLPDGWVWTTLADVALINPRNSADDTLLVSFVPMAMIGARFDSGHEQEIRTWGEVKQGFTHFAEGDVGVAKITPCFENSKACVFSGLSNGVGAGTTELHVVRPLAETLAPRYVLAYLKSPWFLTTGETKMTGTAGQKRLPKDFVETHPFPLPPLAEQHRIVAKVDELMALCDRLEADQTYADAAHAQLVQALLGSLTQATDAAGFRASWQRLSEHFHTLFTTEASVDELKQTVLQLAVMGKLVPQQACEGSAAQLLDEIQRTQAALVEADGLRTSAQKDVPTADQYMEIPDGWCFYRLGNLAKFIDYRGRTPVKTSDGIPLITAKNVRRGHISREPAEFIATAAYADWMTRGIPRAGDILFTTEAPLGNVALIDIGERFALAQRVICFQLHVLEIGPYLRIALMSQLLQDQIAKMATGMTATGVKASKLKELPMPSPPLAEQHRIVAKVDELMALCDQLKAQLQQARQQHAQLASVLVEQAVAA